MTMTALMIPMTQVQPGMSSQPKDRLLVAHENDITRREIAVIDYEAAILNREKLVTARENAADLREGKATSHEQEICEAETIQAASDEHMNRLQQANAHLVIATIEAQELAEQLQTAKAQLEIAKSLAEKANLAKSDFLSSIGICQATPIIRDES